MMICDIERMGKRKKSIWYLMILLIVWIIVAIIAFSNPVPEEPENLPPEAWSYYSGRPSYEVFLIKNRDAILGVLFLFTIVPELLFLIVDYLRK
jgi:flagellar basal body-associated protein FliL